MRPKIDGRVRFLNFLQIQICPATVQDSVVDRLDGLQQHMLTRHERIGFAGEGIGKSEGQQNVVEGPFANRDAHHRAIDEKAAKICDGRMVHIRGINRSAPRELELGPLLRRRAQLFQVGVVSSQFREPARCINRRRLHALAHTPKR